MKTKKIDGNSSVNQEIKGQLVAREVKACFSYEMEAILRASQNGPQNSDYPLPTYDDIKNMYEYRCPECGSRYQDEKEAKECCNSTTEPDYEPQEVFEWWIVSEFLAKKLDALGYPVLDWGNNWYWGRCTTGQAILLDGAITTIAREMEILDGQKYSWAK